MSKRVSLLDRIWQAIRRWHGGTSLPDRPKADGSGGRSALYRSEFSRTWSSLEELPLYQFVERKLQEFKWEIRTLPLHSARRRNLEAQRRVYTIIRRTAHFADRFRRMTASSQEYSCNH